MAVVIETTLGDITVDLYLDQRPVTCLNFLKLCKMKYYNYNLFHSIRSGFIAQTGDPTGEGFGGQSIFGLEGPEKRFFSGEKLPKIRHTDTGLLSMVGTGDMMIGSQFFFTLGPDLDSLDGVHCVIGIVTEGHEVLRKLNEVICDETHRPYRDVRITHTVVLEDPFNDPVGLRPPSRSPSPSAERLKGGRIAPDEDIDETQGKSAAEIQEMIEEKEAKARATILEIVGDLPDADIAPPENVLFVCKLNPVTTDDDLEIIFSRFGKIVSCEVIRDKKTGDSLQYAFIEFDDKKSCEDAYFKMDNVLIDDRRIHVDFSQSVSKMKWLGKGRGVKYFNEDGDKSELGSSDRVTKSSKNYGHNSNDGKKYDRYRENNRHENNSEKSSRRRSRSPVDRNSRRNHNSNDRSSSRNRNSSNITDNRHNGSQAEKNYDKDKSKRYENENISNNRNDRNSHSSPTRSRREEYSRSETEDRERRRKRERNESRDIVKPSKHNSKESRGIDKDDEHTNSSYKRYEKTIHRDHIAENRRSRDSNDKLKDKRDKVSSSGRGYNNDSSKKNHNDKTRNDRKTEEQVQRNEQLDYENDAKVQDKYRKETKEHRHKNYDKKYDKESSKSNKRKHNDREIEPQNRKRSRLDSENIEASTPSPKDKISKKSKNKRDKQKKNKKAMKKRRKPSTSSDSSSDSSSSSESSTSSDGSRKKKSQRRRKKKYSTSSSSSSSSSSESSTCSSSSSSTDSSSSSSSSSDCDAKKSKKNKTRKNTSSRRK